MADGTLTPDQLTHLTVLLYEQRLEEALQVFEEAQLSWEYTLVVLAEMAAGLMQKVVGERRVDPEDLWVLEPVDTAFGQVHPSPPQALQLVMACANEDRPMVHAHMHALLTDEHRYGEAIARLFKLISDFVRVMAERKDH